MVGVGSSRNASGLLMMVSPILCSRWLANRLGSRVAYPHWQTRMYPAAVPNPTMRAGVRSVASTAGTSPASRCAWMLGGCGWCVMVMVCSSRLSRKRLFPCRLVAARSTWPLPCVCVFCQVGVGRFGVSFSPCERRVSGRFGVGRSCWLLVIALVIA